MTEPSQDKITVYYDGSCPSCVRDRKVYEALSGQRGNSVDWYDITNKDDELRCLGIDPVKAMKELHVKDGDNQIRQEMDAYILLMERTFWLRPLALLLKRKWLKSIIARYYHFSVTRRLKRTGRL